MQIIDEGHSQTDAILAELEKQIGKEYDTAAEGAEKKLTAHLKAFEKKDKIKRKLLEEGKISEAQYRQWRISQMMIGKRWEEILKTLAEALMLTDVLATAMINRYMPGVYALNHNYGTYDIEHQSMQDTSYTLYDSPTVDSILQKDPDLLPHPKVDMPKDMRWNKQHINSAILQGIQNGESIPDIAKRLQAVSDMDKRAAIRNARTMTTAAENLGRLDSYKRAQGMGLEFKQEWIATLDFRTRHSHRMLDGEKVEVGKKFSNGCRCPGDPDGRPEEVYNCRCTMESVFEGINDNASDLMTRNVRLGDMTYEEWKNNRTTLSRAEQYAFNKSPIRSVDDFKRTPQYRSIHNKKADKEQYERYKDALEKNAPSSFKAFQQVKYSDDSSDYDALKSKYRSATRKH